MNSKAYLVVFLFLLWSIGSGWFYICKIKQKCDTTKEVAQVESPFTFNYNSDKLASDVDFKKYKEQMLSKLGATNKLKITGSYGAMEQNQTSFDNLGIARAAAIRNVFSEIDDSRFILTSKEEEISSNKDLIKGSRVELAIYNDFVNETENGALIHFGNGDKKAVITPEIHEYLDALITKQTLRDVEIVGHTDSNGDEGENFSLALARAVQIKDELIAKGMSVEKLNAMSKGETEPIADNDTEEGRSQNRRVEIIINE